MEPRNAKLEPRKTGLLNFVKSRYTIVPTPAPNSAALWVMKMAFSSPKLCEMAPLVMAGTAIVAARIASSCWKAKMISWTNFGLSLTL